MPALALPFHPGLRTVTSGGVVILGPYSLFNDTMSAYGFDPPDANVIYTKVEKSWENYSWSIVRRLYGYRPSITLRFSLIDGGPAILKGLQDLFVAGAASETYAALQFNLYADGAGAWRGVFPESDWEPKKAGGKHGGWELDVTLTCRDLIAAPGDWSAGTW